MSEKNIEKIPVNKGVLLYLKEDGSPAISYIGDVKLTELATYARLLSIVEEEQWKVALSTPQTLSGNEGA